MGADAHGRPLFPPRLIRLRDVPFYLGMVRKESLLIALIWTRGWINISPATGVPVNSEEH